MVDGSKWGSKKPRGWQPRLSTSSSATSASASAPAGTRNVRSVRKLITVRNLLLVALPVCCVLFGTLAQNRTQRYFRADVTRLKRANRLSREFEKSFSAHQLLRGTTAVRTDLTAGWDDEREETPFQPIPLGNPKQTGSAEAQNKSGEVVAAESDKGSVTGSVTGSATGSTTGSVTGSTTGSVTGSTTEKVTRSTTGSSTGSVKGLVTASVTGSGPGTVPGSEGGDRELSSKGHAIKDSSNPGAAGHSRSSQPSGRSPYTVLPAPVPGLRAQGRVSLSGAVGRLGRANHGLAKDKEKEEGEGRQGTGEEGEGVEHSQETEDADAEGDVDEREEELGGGEVKVAQGKNWNSEEEGEQGTLGEQGQQARVSGAGMSNQSGSRDPALGEGVDKVGRSSGVETETLRVSVAGARTQALRRRGEKDSGGGELPEGESEDEGGVEGMRREKGGRSSSMEEQGEEGGDNQQRVRKKQEKEEKRGAMDSQQEKEEGAEAGVIDKQHEEDERGVSEEEEVGQDEERIEVVDDEEMEEPKEGSEEVSVEVSEELSEELGIKGEQNEKEVDGILGDPGGGGLESDAADDAEVIARSHAGRAKAALARSRAGRAKIALARSRAGRAKVALAKARRVRWLPAQTLQAQSSGRPRSHAGLTAGAAAGAGAGTGAGAGAGVATGGIGAVDRALARYGGRRVEPSLIDEIVGGSASHIGMNSGRRRPRAPLRPRAKPLIKRFGRYRVGWKGQARLTAAGGSTVPGTVPSTVPPTGEEKEEGEGKEKEEEEREESETEALEGKGKGQDGGRMGQQHQKTGETPTRGEIKGEEEAEPFKRMEKTVADQEGGTKAEERRNVEPVVTATEDNKHAVDSEAIGTDQRQAVTEAEAGVEAVWNAMIEQLPKSNASDVGGMARSEGAVTEKLEHAQRSRATRAPAVPETPRQQMNQSVAHMQQQTNQSTVHVPQQMNQSTIPVQRPTSRITLPQEDLDDEVLFAQALEADLRARDRGLRPHKVAFLFLTRGPLPLAPLWARFLQGHEDRASLFIHTAEGFQYRNGDLPEVFEGAQIPSKATKWGGISIVDAERRLMAHALRDTSNAFFVLVSESCIPVFNFTFIYDYLVKSPWSYVRVKDDKGPLGIGRWSSKYKPVIPRERWRKGSQWVEVRREEASLIVRDTLYYPLFQKFCKGSCYSDEHYFPTILNILTPQTMSNRTITWCDWRRRTFHPDTYTASRVNQGLIDKIRKEKHCKLGDGSSSYCYIFARKFRPDALGPLIALSAYMGF